MKKSYISKIVCLFFIVALIVCGCSFTGLNKYSKNLTEYSIKLNYNNEDKTLQGEEVVNYINLTDVTLNQIDFHLYPNAFKNKNGGYGDIHSGYFIIKSENEIQIQIDKENFTLLRQ